MNSKIGQSWLTLRFVVLGHLFSFWVFFYCGNSDFGSILQRCVTEHEEDWTQSSSREKTEVPPLGKKPSQISCRAWRLRARTWATLASGLSLHCTHLMTALTSRRKKSFSKESRLLEYVLVHKGRFVGTDEDLRSRWQNVRHYGFSSDIHLLVFAMCSCLLWVQLRVTFRTLFCSGIFAFVDSEAQKIRRQKQNDSCNSFVSPVKREQWRLSMCACVRQNRDWRRYMYSFYAATLDAFCVPETAAVATKGDLKLQRVSQSPVDWCGL